MLSLGASFGLSVFVWQYLLGIQIHWSVLVMSVIVLLAVGSDYNLLLVARMKEEIGAGINTGIIRAMAGTGKVVTNAGLVFAFTMGSMLVSDLRTVGQVGTTIGLGSAVRHSGGACIYDAVHRRVAGALVLVAATSAPPPCKFLASARGTPSVGTCLVAEIAAVSGDFQFRTRPATVGSTVAQGDSDSGGCCFQVHGVGALIVCLSKAA